MSRYFSDKNIPKIGLGTWQNEDFQQCVKSVRTALEVGYRHIDTAQFYGNEAAVGEGLKKAGLPRENLFVATKVWADSLDREGVLDSTETSLQKLKLDYVDCLYVHWPTKKYEPRETLSAFEELYQSGKIKHIGVSNFTIDQVKEARDVLETPLFANQVEMHPLLQQRPLLEYLQKNEIYLVAYSPFRHGTIFDQPELNKIAKKHNSSVAQVVLAWQIQLDNVLTIPKATGAQHIRDNFSAMELELVPEDIEKINSLDANDRYVDPPFAPW